MYIFFFKLLQNIQKPIFNAVQKSITSRFRFTFLQYDNVHQALFFHGKHEKLLYEEG